MKFFAVSALAAVASANTYYGGARLATTGLTTGYTTGLSGLSTGYTTGLTGLSTGYTGLTGLTGGYTTGYNTLALAPAVQKVAVVAAQPTFAVQKVAVAAPALQTVATTGYAGGYSYGQAAVAPLAVQTSHQVQYADVPSGGQINPISVEIDAAPIPINMLFKSASSQLNVQQAHQGAAGSAQESSSEDEAHVLKHSVTKPVIQEVREVITPFRRIHQEVQPVQEEINTVVARGVAQRAVAVAAPVQTVQVQKVAVAAPALQTVQVAAPAYQTVAVAAPAVQTVAVAAPAYQAVQTGYQTIAAPAINTFKTFNTGAIVAPAVNTFKTFKTDAAVLTKEY